MEEQASFSANGPTRKFIVLHSGSVQVHAVWLWFKKKVFRQLLFQILINSCWDRGHQLGQVCVIRPSWTYVAHDRAKYCQMWHACVTCTCDMVFCCFFFKFQHEIPVTCVTWDLWTNNLTHVTHVTCVTCVTCVLSIRKLHVTHVTWHTWHAWHTNFGFIGPMWPTWHVWHAWHANWVSVE